MEVLEHQTLRLHNLLSFRAKLTQPEFAAKAAEFDRVVRQAGARKAGPIAAATFSSEMTERGPVSDMEFLIPLDREITPPPGYVWKPELLLENALMVRHVGHPAGMQKSVDALRDYIRAHELVPTSVGYNVTVREAATPAELDQMEVHIYISVSPDRP